MSVGLIYYGHETLKKIAEEVADIDGDLVRLIDTMFNVMYREKGVGLAAPQVGILRRVVVIDVGDGLVELVNPEIIASEGEAGGAEGCLSVPGRQGYVVRPAKVTVRAQDRKGKFFEVHGEDFFARALCHEIDHLDGVLYVDKMDHEIFSDVQPDKEV